MNKLFTPPKFNLVRKIYKGKKIAVLDVGCGNNSPMVTKYWFPDCFYAGVDRDPYYNNSEEALELIDQFFEIDLDDGNLDAIPNDTYDLIIMTHIIEHLIEGDKVMVELIKKLKKGGHMYIEYPSFKSVKLPSMRGTLNFFDDDTHRRIYTQVELYNLFIKHDCHVVKGGTRRYWIFVLLTPIRMLWDLVRYRYVNGSVLWDLMGFAEYILIRKK